MIFVIREKSIILTHNFAYFYNITVLLMAGFVLHGHSYTLYTYKKLDYHRIWEEDKHCRNELEDEDDEHNDEELK